MSIITKADFAGELQIANKSDLAVETNLQWFIDEYEKPFLVMLFGSAFAKLFIDGLAVQPTPETRWTDLRDNTELKKALTAYVYYWYMRNDHEQVTGVGTVKTKNQNAVLSSADKKVTKSWFKMIRRNFETLGYVRSLPLVYPEYVRPNWWGYAYQYFGLYGYALRGNEIPDIFLSLNTYGL